MRRIHTLTFALASLVFAGLTAAEVPTITLTASETQAVPGDTVVYLASVSGGSGTPTGTVTMYDAGGSAITMLDDAGHALFAISPTQAGTITETLQYDGDGTYAAGSSTPLTITVVDNGALPRLANLSARVDVLTGDNVMIAGFIIDGSSPKTVAVVATGPSLAAFGIANPLANPTLQLVRQSDHAVIASNDDWQTDPNAWQFTFSPFAPKDPREAAIVRTLEPGAYTAIVSGLNGATGVSVAGVYEMDRPDIALINISTRGLVLSDNNVMIAGLIVDGGGPQTVVISATGPSLAAFGITNPLADPTLTLVRSSDSAVIATNDDWQSAPNAPQIMSSGFAPTDPRESAVMVTLDPGAYTAIVQGARGSTGVGVVGVFRVP
jgi:hypothetical protein